MGASLLAVAKSMYYITKSSSMKSLDAQISSVPSITYRLKYLNKPWSITPQHTYQHTEPQRYIRFNH